MTIKNTSSHQERKSKLKELGKIEDSFKNKTVLEGEVTKKIKGGYLVQALFHAGFLPNSLSEIPENEEKVNGRKSSSYSKRY